MFYDTAPTGQGALLCARTCSVSPYLVVRPTLPHAATAERVLPPDVDGRALRPVPGAGRR